VVRNGSAAFADGISQRLQRTDHGGTVTGLEAKQDPLEFPSPPGSDRGYQMPSLPVSSSVTALR
jgi:hypothetical protein